jgi:hypothetical protein
MRLAPMVSVVVALLASGASDRWSAGVEALPEALGVAQREAVRLRLNGGTRQLMTRPPMTRITSPVT